MGAESMSLEACPACHRPYSRSELARRRHAEIVRLREYTIVEISQKTGLKYHCVWWHLNNLCKCRVNS